MHFLSRVISCLKYRIYKYTTLSKKQFFISAIDLMQPQNGVANAAQLVVVSRMLDFELIQSGKSSFWSSRLNEHRLGKIEDLEEHDNVYMEITQSMNKYGWDYNLSSICVNIEPFGLYNGTHRCALSLLDNPYQVVPIRLDYDGWDWTRQDGISTLKRNGLSDEEIRILETRYYELLERYNVDYFIMVSDSVYKVKSGKILDKINNFGEITSISSISWNHRDPQLWMSIKNKAFFKHFNDGDKLQVIRYKCFNKDISIRSGEIVSIVIENGLRDIGVTEYAYSATITQSIEFTIWLKQS